MVNTYFNFYFLKYYILLRIWWMFVVQKLLTVERKNECECLSSVIQDGHYNLSKEGLNVSQ
jgi:hypothetical protein